MECFGLPCTNLSTGAANQYFSLLINYLTISQCSLSAPEDWPEDYGDVALRRGFEEYDFIIVGAGSAGSVLANRLSENPDWKILLLEAGGNPPIESTIPALLAELMSTQYDWSYRIEPSNNHSIFSGLWPRGKMLGGSSSINGMLYLRGNADDYNNWEALGNPTWGWNDVLPYFKKSEANQNAEIADAFGGHYHSKEGLMSVQLYKNNFTLNSNIIRAAQELGYKFLLDVNANEHIGFTFGQGTIQNGVRESTAAAFLEPARNRTNLHIVKNAHVKNLEINNEGEVSGVQMILRGHKELKAFAKKEVILSAGAINSPQILMLSGIGPADHLAKFKIPIIRDHKVGKNLQDHPAVVLAISFDKSTAIPVTSADMSQIFYQYLATKTGTFATVGSLETFGFVNVHDPTNLYPDFQYHHISIQRGQTDILKKPFFILGFTDFLFDLVASVTQKSNILLVAITFLTEKSRGEILLRSTHPMDHPRIIPNYLSDPYDVDSFIKSIRLYMKFLNTQSFMEREAELVKIPIPECDKLTFDSDEYWTCYMKYMTTTLFHPVGTVKMGPDSDPDAVVDHKLRVKGTKGLRVIDASIMPRVPRGNTNAPTIMVAEKGADFIKEEYKMNF